ncbi:hypothetical protein VTO42DRAFT_5664 [Malbranchea cinnamomea]
MFDSDSSPLSSAVSTDDETLEASVKRGIGLEKYFKRAKPESPPPPKRPASPPHEYVLADNPDIAFIVMFRERFSDAFPKSLPHFGPQEIERGVTDIVPGDHIERLLCALIGLVLNRKKDVERGHYQRALEEAVQTHAADWPRSWEGKNPLHGGRTFASMTPEERLGFLKALILWALQSSEAIQNILKDGYKLTRHGRDRSSPLEVKPWGQDSWKRRYWLIEGRDDTHFRLYRESNPALKTNTWWSVAGTIDELKNVANSLAAEKTRSAKDLSKKIWDNIPRFEASEEKRKRRDYRLARKAAFARPPSGVSLYEGRTRGKRIKYTFSDDEDDFSSEVVPSRRSTRFQSRVSTPVDNGPIYTASGRQVKSRIGGTYGESMLTGRRPGADHSEVETNGGPRRTRANLGPYGYAQVREGYDSDEMDDGPEPASSGDEYNAADAEQNPGDEDEDMSDEESMDEEDFDIRPSLIVQLRYGKGKQVPKETAYPSPPSGPKSDPLVCDETMPALSQVHEASQPRQDTQKTPRVNGASVSAASSTAASKASPTPAQSAPVTATTPPPAPGGLMEIDSKQIALSTLTEATQVQQSTSEHYNRKVEQDGVA